MPLKTATNRKITPLKFEDVERGQAITLLRQFEKLEKKLNGLGIYLERDPDGNFHSIHRRNA